MWRFVLVALLACSATDGTPACEEYCEARIRCSAGETEAECLWHCFARLEQAGEEGTRCNNKMVCEIECLSGIEDCDQLLDDRIGRNDPCYSEANLREAICGEF